MTRYEIIVSKDRVVHYSEIRGSRYTNTVISDAHLEDRDDAPKNFRIAALCKKLANLVDESAEVLIEIKPRLLVSKS